MPRILGVDIPNDKRTVISLQYIYGIGPYQSLDQALDDPGVQVRLADLGGSLPAKDERTPAKFASFVHAEIARWSPLLKAANGEAK
jgi:hypothetical protein